MRKRLGAMLLVLGVAAVGGAIPGTYASFDAATVSSGNRFALTSLYAPGALSATAVGHDVSLAWPAGQNGNAYRLSGAPAPSPGSPACSGAPYATLAGPSSTSYLDAGRHLPQGTWYCYRVETSYASWTSVTGNPDVAVRLGFVAESVALANGGTAGRLDEGDTLIVTFNQPVNPSTGAPGATIVCLVTSGDVLLGSTTTSGNCSLGEILTLGTLSGGTSNRTARYNASASWSNGNSVLTVTMGSVRNGNANNSVSGPWTFTPATDPASLLSATGSFHVCDSNAGGGLCLPTTSGSF